MDFIRFKIDLAKTSNRLQEAYRVSNITPLFLVLLAYKKWKHKVHIPFGEVQHDESGSLWGHPCAQQSAWNNGMQHWCKYLQKWRTVRKKNREWTARSSRIHLLADSVIWVYEVLPEWVEEKGKLAIMRKGIIELTKTASSSNQAYFTTEYAGLSCNGFG